MPVSRLDKATRQAQYEIPGFAAGVCLGRIHHALFLAARQVERYGETALLRGVIDELCAVQRDIVNWQALARMATNYPAAREAVEQERGD